MAIQPLIDVVLPRRVWHLLKKLGRGDYMALLTQRTSRSRCACRAAGQRQSISDIRGE